MTAQGLERRNAKTVIPAKAGIQASSQSALNPGFRRNDGE
jgi:hypothetical protein